jgi:probable sporulation protein (polysaccharide deacetylase family)
MSWVREKDIAIDCIILVMLFCVSIVGFRKEVSMVFNSGEKAIYRGNTNNKNVSIMINVYWGTEYLDDMLETLKKYDIKTTFFVGGMWANENSDYIKKFINNGHEIANHGYYHKDSTTISKERLQEEIYVTHKLIKSIIGIDMNLFAPPSGAYNKDTLLVASSLDYKTILWSKDTIDWRDKNTELIYKRAVNNPQNGDLILMHPTLNTSQALEGIIKFYKDKGFNLVTVSENIAK